MQELRHFHRIKFAVKTDIEINGKTSETSLVDISLKGARVGFDREPYPELGSQCHLTVHLSYSEVILSFIGEIIYIQDGLAGIKFTLIDIDTMIHLRRLIELNSEDINQVQRELNEIAGFKREED